ncbi:MAG TPA: hypothetical protein VFR90_12155 [Methylibium sp.]|uniref:hypothetical protein n=1 Tax=Methylibium sp. TaxID=2067992 RepID=UPI002DB98F1F|nr:hypothetical protein [Methylibium sp.]HEU4459868.1 hypothetical protein [Methylibium sp.]
MSRRPPATHDDDRATMPAELLTEFCDAAFRDDEMLGVDPLDAVMPAPTLPRADLWSIGRFKELMAAEGWAVQTARMIFDRLYAHERIALGHTSASPELRAIALELFRSLHARDGLEH